MFIFLCFFPLSSIAIAVMVIKCHHLFMLVVLPWQFLHFLVFFFFFILLMSFSPDVTNVAMLSKRASVAVTAAAAKEMVRDIKQFKKTEKSSLFVAGDCKNGERVKWYKAMLLEAYIQFLKHVSMLRICAHIHICGRMKDENLLDSICYSSKIFNHHSYTITCTCVCEFSFRSTSEIIRRGKTKKTLHENFHV